MPCQCEADRAGAAVATERSLGSRGGRLHTHILCARGSLWSPCHRLTCKRVSAPLSRTSRALAHASAKLHQVRLQPQQTDVFAIGSMHDTCGAVALPAGVVRWHCDLTFRALGIQSTTPVRVAAVTLLEPPSQRADGDDLEELEGPRALVTLLARTLPSELLLAAPPFRDTLLEGL